MNMATDTQLEAQRLVSISLSKMAQSRTQRTGVSLHKSLLVATVLQKARFLCMEEVFKMVHPSTPQTFQQQQCYSYDDNDDEDDDDEDDDTLIGLTPEEAGVIQGNDFGNNCLSESSYETDSLSFDEYTSNENTDNYCSQTLVEYDKENLAPSCSVSVIDNATYFDLDDKTSRDQTDKYSYSSSNSSNSNSGRALKRRRTICESETEDCAQLNSRKKTRVSLDDSVFLDEEDEEEIEQLYNVVHGCSEETETENKAMDIDRITSLVSIFSFGTMSNNSNLSDIASSNSSSSTNNCITNSNFGNLTRSSSTPDLCSAQAKEADSIQQRPYLAMTV